MSSKEIKQGVIDGVQARVEELNKVIQSAEIEDLVVKIDVTLPDGKSVRHTRINVKCYDEVTPRVK